MPTLRPHLVTLLSLALGAFLFACSGGTSSTVQAEQEELSKQSLGPL